jgi:dihydroxyacetone kinase
MPGFSLTLLLLPTVDNAANPSSEALISLLDEKVDTPGWKWTSRNIPATEAPLSHTKQTSPSSSTLYNSQIAMTNPAQIIKAVKSACQALIQAEPILTKMDQVAGDGKFIVIP